MATKIKRMAGVAGLIALGMAAFPSAVAPTVLTWDYEHSYTFDWTAHTVTSSSITGAIDFKMECTHALGWYVQSESGTPIAEPDTFTISANEANLEFEVEYVKGASTHTQLWDCTSGQATTYNPDGLPNSLDLGDDGCIATNGNNPCFFTCLGSTVPESHSVTGGALGIVGTAKLTCAGDLESPKTCSLPYVEGGILACSTGTIHGDFLINRNGTCEFTLVMIQVTCDQL